jgi:hypothetical protein
LSAFLLCDWLLWVLIAYISQISGITTLVINQSDDAEDMHVFF